MGLDYFTWVIRICYGSVTWKLEETWNLKSIVFYSQFIISLEGLGMCFSSAILVSVQNSICHQPQPRKIFTILTPAAKKTQTQNFSRTYSISMGVHRKHKNYKNKKLAGGRTSYTVFYISNRGIHIWKKNAATYNIYIYMNIERRKCCTCTFTS